MRHIAKLIVHCSYTPPSLDIGTEEIRDWHVNGNGWSDIGYHYVIRRNGLVEEGRPIDIAGAHVRGHNKDSIGICLVGGKAEHKEESDCNFTYSQYKALVDLLARLKLSYMEATIHGHREFDGLKTCPTFDAQALMEGM